MGDPKKLRKQYSKPRKTWDKARMDKERKLVELYGLKNKREIRKIESLLRRKRESAKKLLSLGKEDKVKKEKELIDSLEIIGILRKDAAADDVLGLGIEDFMERRLQTLVWRKNLAKTVKQARQAIVHGHIAINRKKIDVPGYLVRKSEENAIGYFKKKLILEPKVKEKKEDQKQDTIASDAAKAEKQEGEDESK